MGRNNDCINVASDRIRQEEASLDGEVTLLNQIVSNIRRYYDEQAQSFSKEGVLECDAEKYSLSQRYALLSTPNYIKKNQSP